MAQVNARAFAVSLPAIFAIALPALSQTYTIVDIGALPDLTDTVPTPPTSSAAAINSAGHVAGFSAVSGGSMWIDDNVQIAEPWTGHVVRWIDGVLEDVGVLGPDAPPNEFPRPSAYANDINNLSQIAGEATLVGDGYYHAFLWLPEPAYGLPAGMSELPQITEYARARSVNDDGVVVGESRLPGSVGPRAVRWTIEDGEWTITDLGSLGQEYSIAYGVNNPGQITGSATIVTPPFSPNSHTFLWLPEPAYGLPAGINNLTADLPPGSWGIDINDFGAVVGRSPDWAPMIWLPEPAFGLPAGVTVFSVDDMFEQEILDSLGFLFTVRGELHAINNNGIAVGNMEFAVLLPNGNIGLTQRGIVWKQGEFSITQTLLPPDSPWTIISATEDVNDSGQLVGAGLMGEHWLGYVMTPDLPGDINADGVVDLNDQAALIAVLLDQPLDPAHVTRSDLNGDGTANGLDIGLLVSYLLQP